MADPSSLLADTGGAIAALPPGADPAVFDHGDGVDTATGLRHVAAQARALTTKNLLVLLRRKKSTAAYVLMPSLAILSVWAMIVGTASWLDPSTSAAHMDYPLAPLRVRKCEVFDSNNLATGALCTTAMFAPDSPNAVSIMRKFCAATGLEYGTDVMAARSPQAVADVIAHHPGTVDAAVIFTEPEGSSGGAAWGAAGGSDAPALEYQLWTNTTGSMERWLTGDDRHLLDQAGVYGHYEAVIQAVDAAIIGHVSGQDDSAEIQIGVGRFAELASSLPGHGTSCIHDSSVGCSQPDLHDLISWAFADLGLVLGTSFTALMVLYTISSEKEAKLLAALRTVGLREWLFWTSWALAYFVLAIFGAALSTTLGSVLNLRMFVQCAWFVQFLAALLFMQSFAALGIFLASFITRGRYIITSSMVVLVIVFAVCGTWKGALTGGLHFPYGPDSDWFTWTFASIQPWFHYMRVEMAILATIYPTAHLRENELERVLENPEPLGVHYFSFGHLSNATVYDTIDYRMSPVKFVEYSTGASLWAMLCLSFFYYWLAWYFGQVSSPDEGSHEHCCFCFSPNYWGIRRKQALVMDDDDSVGLEKSRSMLDRSVRTYKLSKAYKEEMAVQELSMEIESSCCLALLGTNGAGKSTLIKTLTGVHAPTYGEAFIFGLDVREDMAKLQKIMGCCPQEDLLWPELTAREHLDLYARFKGIAQGEIVQHCADILTAVGLVADADNHVSTYSGGMKRRLSVGIASVASPTIMFLDEPSTGMDPLSKRRVWTMIEQLKKDRVMLLTTHSMEEADALGDKVAILDKGRLRATGSSLFLKRTYGKGHTVSLLSEVDAVPRVEQLIKSSIPSAEILGSDAGNTSVSIKRSAVLGIPRLFSSLMAEEGLIKEWGLSDTTLEEVFLRLAAQNKEVNAEIEGQDDDDVGRVMLVRSSSSGSTTPQLVAVLEASNPSSIVVVGPDGNGLEIVADEGEAGEGDVKRYVCVAQGGATVQVGAEMGTEECGRISQFDEIVVLDEVTLPTGICRVQCDAGWVSTKDSDGTDVLREVKDDSSLAMDELLIPDAGPEASPTMQMIDMTVPSDVEAGQKLTIEIGGKKVTVAIPSDAEPGTRIQVPVPLPQLQEGAGLQGLTQIFDSNSVKTVGVAQQTFAVVWKNAILAFGCRKGRGCRGCMSCKCLELCCYVSLFVIMAMVAIAHLWIVTMMEGMQRDLMDADHDRFCADGVEHVTFERGFGWAPASRDDDDLHPPGSYCPYQHDGFCDEPDTCAVGSDVGDCPVVELHATQFSSCDRAAVAEEMMNLSTRALLTASLPSDQSVHATDVLRRQEHQTWTSACNDNDRQEDGGACWADLVAASSTGLFIRGQATQYGHMVTDGSCALRRIDTDPACSSEDAPLLCAGLQELTSQSGIITAQYGSNADCSWDVRCPDTDSTVRLTFAEFALESGYDYVSVFDGSDANQTMLLLHHSGHSLPNPVNTSSRSMLVHLTSDSYVEDQGFTAQYQCISADGSETISPSLQPEPEPEPEPPSCVPGADIWFTDAKETRSGQSTKLSELSLLPGGDGLEWVQESSGYLSMLGLSDLRGHVDRSSSDLYGGGIAMRFREIDTGSIHERVIAAQKYNRDQIAQDAHCTATSGECHGFIQAESRSGTLTSEGYENNAACEWLLTCPDEGSVVVLSFSSFGTESCCDHVQVYDGSTQWDMSLLTLQGHYNFDGNPYGSSNCQNAYGSSNCQNAPEPVASSGRSMLVRLTSDSSVTDNGFHASFECSASAGSTTSNVNATVQYSEHGFAERQHSGPQFSSPAEADAWFRQSFPALAIEVAESVIDDSSTTFRYAVRQWTAHAYQAYPFLRTSSSGCGQDQCWLERDVEFVSPSSSECTHDCERETTADKTLRGVISAMSNSLLRTKLGMADASLTATIVPMPEFTYWQTRRRVNDSFALWLVMYPLLTMLLIPTLASMLASEKEKGLLDMVRMEGGRTVSFFLGNWLFTFAYSLMFSVLFVLTIMFSGAADADSGVQMPGSRVAALVVLWAHAQTGFVHFIGLCIFRKARHAALFGAFAVIVAVMVGWTATIMEAEHLITSDLFPVSCLLIPPLAYTRTVGVLLWYGGGEEFDRGLIMLAVDGFLYFFCAVCYSLWPQEEARQLLVKLVRRAKGQGAAGAELLLDDNTVVSTGGGTPFKSDDVSVVAERERASSAAAAGSAAAIRIEGLVKDFTAISGGKEVTKRAVNELYLSIERGEVFGMLGPNGAGKTTTIQMLTGMTPPTGGSASVCGFDIARQMDHVKCVIGVCPQFDVLWEDLTVRQHLRFYSLLRGLPRARIEVEARRLAEKMELDGDPFNKPASTLSGGAKRRLSIAIALAGKPPCLFFDEPTTGLDPETRRQIWRIIKAEQRDNAIVITTHSMEEADALCSRVGIMAGGSLRAVGSQMYLKSRFGDGFKVTLNCVDESTRRLRRVNDFIMSFSDKAQFVSRFGAHLTYTVPMAGGDVAGIFNRMETSKSELGVVEWGVTQASLEEVFIKVVLQWEEGVHGQSFRNAFANPMLPPGGGDGSSSDED